VQLWKKGSGTGWPKGKNSQPFLRVKLIKMQEPSKRFQRVERSRFFQPGGYVMSHGVRGATTFWGTASSKDQWEKTTPERPGWYEKKSREGVKKIPITAG